AKLYCRGCGREVRRDTPASILEALRERSGQLGDPRLLVGFEVARPSNLPEKELRALLESQGYVRILEPEGTGKAQHDRLTVIQDRFRLANADTGRASEALEASLRGGRGHVVVHALDDEGATRAVWRFSAKLHCA